MLLKNGKKNCSRCGSNVFYTKESYKGNCEYKFSTIDDEVDNCDMHAGAIYKNTSKFVFCNGCDKIVCKMQELEVD